MEIIVISINRYYFPSQLVILNSKGELLGEFWNSGYLIDYCFSDVNGDKGVELIVSGNYILIPPTDVENCISLRNRINVIDILNNQIISAKSGTGQIYYEFNFDLKLININFSDVFKIMHRKYLSENKITSKLDKDYKAHLMKGLLYYDGQKWVSHPTSVKLTSPTPAR